MNNYKLFAQRIGLIGATNLLLSLSGIILLPVLTKNLPIEEYGIWAQIMVTIGLVPSLVMLGLSYTMVRFLPSLKKKEEIQEVFYSILFLILLTSLIASLLIYIFSKPLAYILFESNVTIVKVLSIIVFIECINDLFLNYLRAKEKIKLYSILMTTKTSTQVILVFLFVTIGMGILGATIGVLISVLLIFLILTFIVISDIGIKVPKCTNIKGYLNFGLPTVPSNLSMWVVNSSDRYVISILLGAAYVGYYSPGYSLGSIISIFLAPFSFLLPTILSKNYDEGNLNTVKVILEYSLKYFLIISIPAVFGLSLLSKPILTILTTPEIASQTYIITPFVAFSTLLFGFYTILFQIIILNKNTKVVGKIWIFAAILNLGLNFFLIPYIGIIGAAITTLIAFIFSFVITAHNSSKIIKFNVNYIVICKSIFASVIMSAVIVLIKPSTLLEIASTIGFCVVIYTVMLLVLQGFDKNEFYFFKELIKY
jgi:O-antigen/teichoic acid export membrane protein